MANLKRLLMHPRLNVHVWVFPEIRGETDRQILAEKSRTLISEKYDEEKESLAVKL